MVTLEDIRYLPGAELVRKGIEDLRADIISSESILVKIDAANLHKAGLLEDDLLAPDANLELYNHLASRTSNPHAEYKSLIERITKFDSALIHFTKNKTNPN